MLRTALGLAVCLVLCGCASLGDQVVRAGLPAGPPAWQDGYVPGCKSGATAAGSIGFQFTKDFDRYQSDALYKQGWDDGFRICSVRAKQ